MRDFESEHRKNILRLSRQLEKLYIELGVKISKIANDPKAKFQKSFKFSNNLEIQKKTDKLLQEFNAEVLEMMSSGISDSWGLSNTKNDILVKETIKAAEVLEIASGLTDHNISALEGFLKRNEDGLNLSKRIWNNTQQYTAELEAHLRLGILNGDSANVISRRIRQYLEEPDKLFRRVRDKNGNLVWSKNAKLFNPGKGRYRSSYRNARRLASTETNMSYRTADLERWNKNPTVVGYEIKLSSRHPAPDICDSAAGKYPKEFIFTGWHPNCFCYLVPILITDVEFDKYEDSILNGTPYDPTKSKNNITKPPAGYIKWMKDNEERIAKMKKPPYFVRDNYKKGDIKKGLKLAY